MNEIVDSLDKATVFSKVNANSGYCQIEIVDADKGKTAFPLHHGLYRFMRTPFSLQNAPLIFQHTMDVILPSVKRQFALVYIKDFVSFSKTLEQQIDNVSKILLIFYNARVTLKLNKCNIISNTIDLLYQVFHRRRLELASQTTNVTRVLEPSSSHSKLRSFHGHCNVVRRLIPNFARIMSPINRRLKTARLKKICNT